MIVAACEGGEAMEGIQFVTNDKGERVAVLIDLARHGEMCVVTNSPLHP